MTVAWIGLGGCVGSVLRYLLGNSIRGIAPTLFPWATLAVNFLGCLGIGLATSWAERVGALGSTGYLVLTVGVLGGFTTFSAFGLETLALMRAGQSWMAFGYVAASLGLGIGAVALGRAI